MLPWTWPLILWFLTSSAEKQRLYCGIIVKFSDYYENHLVQDYLITDIRFTEVIILMTNILFSLSWVFTFFLPTNFTWLWGNAILPVDIVLARTHQDSLFSVTKMFITNWLRQKYTKVQLLWAAGMAGSRCSEDAVKNLLPVLPHLHLALFSLSGRLSPCTDKNGLQQL